MDQYGRSPLHVAAENGQLAAAMLFLNEQVWAAAPPPRRVTVWATQIARARQPALCLHLPARGALATSLASG